MILIFQRLLSIPLFLAAYVDYHMLKGTLAIFPQWRYPESLLGLTAVESRLLMVYSADRYSRI